MRLQELRTWSSFAETLPERDHPGLGTCSQSPAVLALSQPGKLIRSCLRIVSPGQDGAADTEDEVAGQDGIFLVPPGVDREFPPPGVSPVNDVVMVERAGVEHLTYQRNVPLHQLNLGISNLQ